MRPAGFQPAARAGTITSAESKTRLGAQTGKSVFRREGQQFGGMSSRFDWLPRNGFAADARNQNGAAPPNAARPGEFAGQNSEAKRDDDNCGSRQNNHHQPDQYNAEANRTDEKSAQARPRFEPETRNPFLKPTIHKKGLSVKVPTAFDCALSREETR
jgi:hypothetical protein